MSRAPWVSHFGFTRTPFSKTIPAAQLCDRASHQEAVARIRFCISESLLGVITGEVGVGKTVAVRAATSQLDATAHHIIYVATPTFGARGLYLTIVPVRVAPRRSANARASIAAWCVRGAGSAHRDALPVGADGPFRGRAIPPPPPGARRSYRRAVCRRCDRTVAQTQPRAATCPQQRSYCRTHRRCHRWQGAG